MLKIRVIPTMLWKEFGLVKGASFDSWRRVGPVLPAIKIYNHRDVDELILVDINAHELNQDLDLQSIREFSQDCFVPFTVGGGINSVDKVQKLLRAGADKVCLNSSSFNHPELLSDIANRHGSQCIVASIDVRKDTLCQKWYCFSEAGKKYTGIEVRSWAREVEDRGAGEILITSIERDGTLQGYDLDLIEAVVNTVKIPVIASGGAGNCKHMIDAVNKAGASAVAAASIFHFTELTPADVKL